MRATFFVSFFDRPPTAAAGGIFAIVHPYQKSARKFVQNYLLTFSRICGIIIIESEGNIMKYFLAPIQCKECEFKSRSILRLLIHLKKEHKTTFTKRDWKFAIKHFFPFRLLVALVSIILGVAVWLLWMATFPIWAIHEWLDNPKFY